MPIIQLLRKCKKNRLTSSMKENAALKIEQIKYTTSILGQRQARGSWRTGAKELPSENIHMFAPL